MKRYCEEGTLALDLLHVQLCSPAAGAGPCEALAELEDSELALQVAQEETTVQPTEDLTEGPKERASKELPPTRLHFRSL